PGPARPAGAPYGATGPGAPAPGVQDRAPWTAEASPYAATAPRTTAPLPPYAPGTGAPLGAAPPPVAPPVAPPRAPEPPKPPKPPRPGGPGATTTGVVVGISLLLGAFLLVVERSGDLPWPVFLTWAALSTILAGLAIVVSGLRGRTSGGLGWLAVI